MKSELLVILFNMLIASCALLAYAIGGSYGVTVALPITLAGLYILLKRINPLQTDAERVLQSLNDKDRLASYLRFINLLAASIVCGLLTFFSIGTAMASMIGGMTTGMVFVIGILRQRDL